MELDEAPLSWTTATIGDIAAYVQRGKSPRYAEHSKLPVINQKCIRWYGIEKQFVKFIHEDQIPDWDKSRYLQHGDLLWNSTGTGTIGRAVLYKNEFRTAVVDSHVTVVRVDPEITDPRYLLFFVMSPLVQSNFEVMQSGSTNQVELSRTAILEKQLPLAPLNEQRRIVEKIETLFARLDKGEEALREVQKLLARYRQSVLKAAVTGELTADWRAENAHRLEHGRDLLARILKTRRENWTGRGNYKEPVAPDTAGLPELPEGWVWASLAQLLKKIEAGKNFRCDERPPNDSQVGIVKISAVTWGTFDEQESKTIISNDHINPKLTIKPGDLLISRANTLELVGASVVVRDVKKRLQLSDKVLRLKLVEPVERWVNTVLRSALGRKQIEDFATGAQMSMRNISQANLERICIPLPSLAEMDQALKDLRNGMNNVTYAEQASSSELVHSAALRQSILKDAFAGRLVPQDPVDEPASALLARVKQSPTATPRKLRRKATT